MQRGKCEVRSFKQGYEDFNWYWCDGIWSGFHPRSLQFDGGVRILRTLPLVAVLLLLLLFGCSANSPETNYPPRAKIASISPAEAQEGQVVSFAGYGSDLDGEVVAYLWQSNSDGELSRLPSFETDSLSEGTHEISFTVEDDDGAWSEIVYASINVVAAVAIHVEVNSFSASPSTIEEGDSAMLSWNVSNATTVVIDQNIGMVSDTGTKTVSPEHTTTYTLIAITGEVTETGEVTVTVVPPPEPLPLFGLRKL